MKNKIRKVSGGGELVVNIDDGVDLHRLEVEDSHQKSTLKKGEDKTHKEKRKTIFDFGGIDLS